MLVSIGNGLWAASRPSSTLLEQYRAKQARCPHAKRDPRGTCYECGQKKEAQ